jgi:subtilisin family serine protease
VRTSSDDLFSAPEGAFFLAVQRHQQPLELRALLDQPASLSLLDEDEPLDLPRFPAHRRRARGVSESPCRGPGRPVGASRAGAALLAGLFALGTAACGEDDGAPIAPDHVLVQLLPGQLPSWRLQEGEWPVQALASVGPEDEPTRLSVPVPPGRAPRELCRELASDPAVELCEPVGLLRQSKLPDDPRYKELWGMAAIGAPAAWDRTQGDPSVVVAVVDDGVALTHAELAPNLWVNPHERPGNGRDDDGDGYADDVHGWDFVDGKPDGAAITTGDAPWHGSHVSGTIGAAGNNKAGVSGVNWRVSLMALRALGPQGGRTDDLARAIDYAADHGARVINASWGGGGSSQILNKAISRAGKKGALFVVAAGNSGAASPEYPANLALANVLSVGALGPDGALASFSDRGALLAAPGVGILSTIAPGRYERYDGTSMVAPHVSGAAALLFAAHPEAHLADVREALLSSAAAMGGVQHGRIDLPRALAALDGKLGGGAGGSALVLSRTALAFTSTGSAPRAQTVSVRDEAGAAGRVQIKASAAWLVPSVTEGTLPLRLSVKVDPSRLGPGTHQGKLTLDAGRGATATLAVTLRLTAAFEEQGPLVLGGPCSIQAGALHAKAGALCALLPAGFDEQADDRAGRWTLPGGAASPGARLHAAFAQPGDYTLRFEDGDGEVTTLPVVVEP